MEKPVLPALPRAQERLTYLYLEHCRINRDDNAITATDARGVVHIPAASVSVLLLGPGTSVTHRAIDLMSEACITAVWVGEHGVRYYSSGRALSRHTELLIRQAQLVSNVRLHAEVVRRMYSMRFPNEDVSGLTIQQLRGREGSRIRRIYHDQAAKWDVSWNGREYDPDRFEDGDTVNQALSIGNSCLYGLATAMIVSLGCSPGLGFVHVGHELSFAYDIADLYKAEITIPIAFEVAATSSGEAIFPLVRSRVRDAMIAAKLPERMVHDIKALLHTGAEEPDETTDVLYLWDKRERSESGRQYAEDESEENERS